MRSHGGIPRTGLGGGRRVLVSLFLLMILALSSYGEDLNLQPVTPLTLPSLGMPFQGPVELSGQSGFFWTRSATEAGTLALAQVPILKDQIQKLKDLGTKQSIKLDDQDGTIHSLIIVAVVAPVVAFIIDEVVHAIR